MGNHDIMDSAFPVFFSGAIRIPFEAVGLFV